MKNTKLIVKTKSKTYPIYFGNNILNKTGWLIKKKLPGVKKICIISDNKLPKLLLKKLIRSLKIELMNDFVFINDLLNGPNKQHDARRLENGNIMIFDNGDGRQPALTRVSEYEINEDEMTATLVWQYSHPDGHVSLNQGCAQRLENQNTLISWGGGSNHGAIITEVDYSGNRVLEFEYPSGNYSYKVRKNNWDFNINLTEADINLDDNVDILDVVNIVSFIISNQEPDPFYLYKADLDKSGSVDVVDVVLILGLIL